MKDNILDINNANNYILLEEKKSSDIIIPMNTIDADLSLFNNRKSALDKTIQKLNKKNYFKYIIRIGLPLLLIGIIIEMALKSKNYKNDMDDIVQDKQNEKDQCLKDRNSCHRYRYDYYHQHALEKRPWIHNYDTLQSYGPLAMEANSIMGNFSCSDRMYGTSIENYWINQVPEQLGEAECQSEVNYLKDASNHLYDYCINPPEPLLWDNSTIQACELAPIAMNCSTLLAACCFPDSTLNCYYSCEFAAIDIGTGLDDSTYLAIIIPTIIITTLALLLECCYKWTNNEWLFKYPPSETQKLQALVAGTNAVITATSTLAEIRNGLTLAVESLEAKIQRYEMRKQFLMAAIDKNSPASLIFHSDMQEPNLCRMIFYFAGLDEIEHSKKAAREAFIVSKASFFKKLNQRDHRLGYLKYPQRKITIQRIFEYAEINNNQSYKMDEFTQTQKVTAKQTFNRSTFRFFSQLNNRDEICERIYPHNKEKILRKIFAFANLNNPGIKP